MVRPFRSTAAVASTALIITLISPVAPAAAAEQLEIPALAGTDVLVGDTLAGVGLSMFYPSVTEDTTAYFSLEDWDDDNFGAPPAGSFPIAYIQAYLYDSAPIEQDVTTCFDYSLVSDPPQDLVVYTDATPSGALEAVSSFNDGANVTCVSESGLIRTGIYMLSSDQTAPPTNADITITRVDGPAPILQGAFGEGDINGSHLQVEVTNNDTERLVVGLGADLRVQGVDEKLWLGSAFGVGEDFGEFGEVFAVGLEPGESASLTVPDWPGKTFTFHSIDVDNVERSVVLDRFETGGLFVPLIIDLDAGIGEVGSVAEFSGDRVFPGATTTVSADGLVPGETYDLWLTTGVDYFAFLILGAVLADDAIKVGEGTVGSDGRLRATFAVPQNVIIGDRYQLMVGDPATRSWPAGTLSQVTIQAPQFTSSVDLPTPTDRELELELGGLSVAFSFPAGTTSGQTVASVSSTGPAAVGFSLIGGPNAYMHLSTTATFTGAVEVCVTNSDLADPSEARLYHYVLVAGSYQWVDITTRYDGDAVCGETTSFSPFALGVPDFDLEVTRVFEKIDFFGIGEEQTEGVHLDLTVTNNTTEAMLLSIGADFRVEGQQERLWLDDPFNLGQDLGDATFTVNAGETLELGQLPDIPGKTLTFWRINSDDLTQATVVASYRSEGLFVPTVFDAQTFDFQIGSPATFAGTEVFPGVTTTVTAEGLIPGEAYELWLAPDLDYASFLLLGAVLSDSAIQVGSATVDATGRLASAFTIPVDAEVGDRYQLMIGDPDTRSWPAGTSEPLNVVTPSLGGGTEPGPTAGERVVSIPLAETSISFTFPVGSVGGAVTASASTTGPAAVGFTMLSDPPVYLHLSTTTTFSGQVEVCVDVPGGGDSTGLRLYHYVLGASGYEWVDITSRYEASAVCGLTDSFSPFALGIPDVPVVDDVVLTSKAECKKGGWATSTLPVFKNQGDCVSHFATQKAKGKGK